MSPSGHPAIRLTVADAERLAAERYGLRVTARALPGEYDDNFHLVAADGAAWVLKAMHPEREAAFIDMQCRALEHVAARAPDLVVPRVVRTTAGVQFEAAAAADGSARLVWLLGWIPGRPMATLRRRAPGLLEDLGRRLGGLSAALAGFDHPGAHREIQWDLARAGWAREHLSLLAGPGRRELVEAVLGRYEAEVVPALPALRRSVAYADANDHNVLVRVERGRESTVAGFVDFGDTHHTVTVAEVAVAAAYALLGEGDPVGAAARVVAGYHAVFPLLEEEIALLDALVRTRLAVSVVTSARRGAAEPDDPYLTVSERPAWEALERLSGVHPRLAHYVFRAACGLEPVPHGTRVVERLRAVRTAPVLDVDLRTAPCPVLDLSIGSRFLGADPAALETPALTERVFAAMSAAGARVGIGRYDEARAIYTTASFAGGAAHTDEGRTVHLGIDLCVAPGTPVHAPLEGTVHCVANNAAPKDYGPLVILRHELDGAAPFYTLFGHLDRASVAGLASGRRVAAGERIAAVGAPPENGDWWPHVHVQIILDLLDLGADFPGVARASQRAVWTSLSPDPNLLLGIPSERFPPRERRKAETLAARRARLGRNLSVSYREPLKIVRGWMQYLYDETGRAYFDAYNNVPLVGHSHPRVVRAVQDQMALLNTNTRYLHDDVVRYAERLAALLPAPLEVCYLLNSASEANELALRLARAHTGREDVVVLEAAYHGHTTSLVDISPYKFGGPGGGGRKPWVHVVPLPDDYRGPYRRGDPDAGARYAAHVGAVAAETRRAGGGVAAFIAESLPSVGGQIVLPPGYLEEAYRCVRATGGICIADEVQVGFGRLGTHFWGFETQGVVPDVVVLGKPIGNGFPLAAVITTPAVAASFDNGMEFFSTFGGNPVACAAGLAVLDVLEEERLQERALRVGTHLGEGLRGLMARHPVVGDVRGSGLFLGVELVRDHATLEPAAAEAAYVVERLRERGVLTGTDGPYHNVIKIRPPLVCAEADADLLVAVMDDVLAEDAVRGPWEGA